MMMTITTITMMITKILITIIIIVIIIIIIIIIIIVIIIIIIIIITIIIIIIMTFNISIQRYLTTSYYDERALRVLRIQVEQLNFRRLTQHSTTQLPTSAIYRQERKGSGQNTRQRAAFSGHRHGGLVVKASAS